MLFRVWLRQLLFYENYPRHWPVSPVIEYGVAVFYFPALGLVQSIRHYLELDVLNGKNKRDIYQMLHKVLLWIKMIIWLAFAVWIASNIEVYNHEFFPPMSAKDIHFLMIPLWLIEGLIVALKYIQDRTRNRELFARIHPMADWVAVVWMIVKTVVWTVMLSYVVIHWIHLNAIGNWETVGHHFGEVLNCLYPLSVFCVTDLFIQRRRVKKILHSLQMPEFGEAEK